MKAKYLRNQKGQSWLIADSELTQSLLLKDSFD